MQMQDALTAYTQYYKVRHSGHVLSWDHALGTATLKGSFTAGAKEISVSLYQAVVLLLFNDAKELKFTEIMEATRMGEPSCVYPCHSSRLLNSHGVVFQMMESCGGRCRVWRVERRRC